jgi:hypothetical protein
MKNADRKLNSFENSLSCIFTEHAGKNLTQKFSQHFQDLMS